MLPTSGEGFIFVPDSMEFLIMPIELTLLNRHSRIGKIMKELLEEDICRAMINISWLYIRVNGRTSLVRRWPLMRRRPHSGTVLDLNRGFTYRFIHSSRPCERDGHDHLSSRASFFSSPKSRIMD